jgi:cytochrome c553
MPLIRLLSLIGLAALAAASVHAAEAGSGEFFEQRVRPVLAEHCYGCHGPAKQKGGLRADHGSLLLKGGDNGPALVAGQPEVSRLLTAVGYGDVSLQMPPTGKLPEAVIADLRAWIAAGAAWPEEPVPGAKAAEAAFDLAGRRAAHWAWQPLRDDAPPSVGDAGWPRGEMDRFVLAKLEATKLRPAPEAPRETLLRRLTYDLTGLPPTPDELTMFQLDTGPEAYERLVDRLLASPRFGEHWGRHWLDLTRYAETYGFEGDFAIKEAWRYRDYVIRALNADVPYDQFVREHLAGDLLAEPRQNVDDGTNESLLATGCWAMHQAQHAPVDVRMDNADRVDNQIDVFSKTFLGLTVSCARCHDHKFDAISTADYYALSGIFRSARQQIAELDPKGAIAEARGKLAALSAQGAAALGTAARAYVAAAPQATEFRLASEETVVPERIPGEVSSRTSATAMARGIRRARRLATGRRGRARGCRARARRGCCRRAWRTRGRSRRNCAGRCGRGRLRWRMTACSCWRRGARRRCGW